MDLGQLFSCWCHAKMVLTWIKELLQTAVLDFCMVNSREQVHVCSLIIQQRNAVASGGKAHPFSAIAGTASPGQAPQGQTQPGQKQMKRHSNVIAKR